MEIKSTFNLNSKETHNSSSNNSKNTNHIIHLLELVIEILSFRQIFNMRKTTTQRILCLRKSARKSTKKYIFLTYFQTFKSKLQIIQAVTYIHCFFLTLINVFFIHFYYFLILCSYFHLLFLALLTTRHILQFTMFDTISLKPARNVTEIKNTSQSITKEKVSR